jgi:hypothetical protein
MEVTPMHLDEKVRERRPEDLIDACGNATYRLRLAIQILNDHNDDSDEQFGGWDLIVARDLLQQIHDDLAGAECAASDRRRR